ncbi:MAG: anhydro-N-acetylmuramic acid kinase [Planctomycetes bacterium]|nr:anhydro-N-acetylmuramic acid kinase [Planctomycetota bacterium]MBM4084885.1 anhydro-N-acetylmuramic acid kinase [Planctomycetota bacterium]
MSTTRKVIGLMSGTSCDGVDACLAEITGSGLNTKARVLEFRQFPYPDAIRARVLEACTPEKGTVEKICHLNFVLGHLFAQAAIGVAQSRGMSIRHVDLIGSHGQTVYHIPTPQLEGEHAYRSTLQIGEPSVIAQETGVTVVADFRPRDIAAGGQGAPLVPYVDFILFRELQKSRAIQNIGGIANVTFLPAHGGIQNVIAFDTGPGNMIMDRLAYVISREKMKFDKDGLMARQGKRNDYLLKELMSHPFLAQRPPKSTGREEFGTRFADRLYADAFKRGLSDADILATATAFTAESIVDAYKRFVLPVHRVDEVILCGGGARNKTLVGYLEDSFGTIPVRPIDQFGIPAEAKEALSFAILANETLAGNPNNVPAATGAKHLVVLGKIVPGESRYGSI